MFFHLAASTSQSHERGVPFKILKWQRGDIEWMKSSRDNIIPLANKQKE